MTLDLHGRQASLFKAFLSPVEIDAALRRLAKKRSVEVRKLGRDTVAVSTAPC